MDWERGAKSGNLSLLSSPPVHVRWVCGCVMGECV